MGGGAGTEGSLADSWENPLTLYYHIVLELFVYVTTPTKPL